MGKADSKRPPPSQDELCVLIDKGHGQLLKDEDIKKRKKAGELPDNFRVDEGFGVYRLEVGDDEYLCVTNILCEKCQRVNGRVKRCPQHKKKKKKSANKKKKGNGEIEDDASDRDKLGALRHIDDEEEDEDKIDGAVTPYSVLTPGIGGAVIMVIVNSRNNEKAGPPAKNMHHVKGILVRGAGNIPQFVPNDRMTKLLKLRFDNYIEGELIMAADKAVFVPNSLGAAKMDDKNVQTVAKAAIGDKVDQKLQDAVGKDVVVAVQVDVADNGMPMMKIIKEKPKNKETPVGVVLKVNDQIQFVQVGGKELGGGQDAPLVPTTPKDDVKQGDVIADVALNPEGKAVAYKPGEVPKDGKVVGKIVAGKNQEPVFVANGEKVEDAIKKQEQALTPEVRDKLEKAQVDVQSTITGQAREHIANQVEKIGATPAADGAQGVDGASGANGANAGGGPQEVKSVGFGAQQFGGSCFARPNPVGAQSGYGGAGGGGGGAGGAGKQGGGGGGAAAGGGYQYGSGGEVKSVGFGAPQIGGSVFMTKSPAGGGGGAGGGGYGGAKSGGGGGGSKMGSVGNAAGGGSKMGNVGGGGANAGGYQFGSDGEVKSVGFGAPQAGGSVFVTSGGGGGGARGGQSGNVNKSPSKTANNQPTGITRGPSGEVRSSFLR